MTTLSTPGRNDPCPCRSGKKYKRCCLSVRRAFDPAAQRSIDSYTICWALQVVKTKIETPSFERRLYQADTPQARFLRQVCAEAGSLALPFGLKVFEGALSSLKGTPLDHRDPRGLLLGLHAKTLDELIGLRAALGMGSLGPAMVGARVIFETYLQHRHLLRGDLDHKVSEYRLTGVDEAIKDAREKVLAGVPTGRDMEILFQLGRARTILEQNAQLKAERASVLATAERVGLGRMYASLYRMASGIAHAADGDLYNPVIAASLANDFPWEQPYFLTGFGLWSVGDVIALASFVDVVPTCLFGSTAKLFNVQLDTTKAKLVELFQTVIDRDDLGGINDLRTAFPELFP